MTPKKLREMIEREQTLANAMRNPPLELKLGSDPGPYRSPRCIRVGLYKEGRSTMELTLDTEADQRLLIPLSAEAFQTLCNLVDFATRPPTE
jgi:hypothetical protein